MSALQAALGLAQLERIDELVVRKKRGLRLVPGGPLRCPRAAAECGTSRNEELLLDGHGDLRSGVGGKDAIGAHFSKHNIDTRPIFSPLSSLPAYAAFESARAARRKNSVSYRVGPNGLNLPSALNLKKEQVDRVCSILKSYRHAAGGDGLPRSSPTAARGRSRSARDSG